MDGGEAEGFSPGGAHFRSPSLSIRTSRGRRCSHNRDTFSEPSLRKTNAQRRLSRRWRIVRCSVITAYDKTTLSGFSRASGPLSRLLGRASVPLQSGFRRVSPQTSLVSSMSHDVVSKTPNAVLLRAFPVVCRRRKIDFQFLQFPELSSKSCASSIFFKLLSYLIKLDIMDTHYRCA